MSSVVLFNTNFPVDASTVSMLNRFASHAVDVLKEISMQAPVQSPEEAPQCRAPMQSTPRPGALASTAALSALLAAAAG